MSVITAARPGTGRLYLPGRKRWTRREFERLADSGLFAPDARLELIEGEIIVREKPMKARHATGIRRVETTLRRTLPQTYYLQIQLPLALGEHNEPLPDIALVPGSIDDYEEDHPTTALLVIEVSDTTLREDRTTKASLYARAGIPEYWVVNLVKRLLEAFRDPGPQRGKPLGYGYASVTSHAETATISPLCAPDAVIAVADLLPRRKAEA